MSCAGIVVIFMLLSCCSVYCADILCVFSFPATSHQRFFQPIWKHLSLHGHRVVVITPNPLKDKTLTNLTEIDVSSSHALVEGDKVQSVMDFSDPMQQYNNIIDLSFAALEHQFSQPQVQELLRDPNRKFDVVLVESFYPMLYALGNKYNVPVIAMTSLPMLLPIYLAVGSPIHPVISPDVMLGCQSDLSLGQKMYSVYHTARMAYNHYYRILPNAQKIASRMFEDVPDLYVAERNASLSFIASNQLIYPVLPTVPALIHLSLVHVEKPKELPQDLKKIADEATEGLVYFSLGSNVKSIYLSDKLKQVILTALGELPYKVIWKWESDHLPGKPANVIIRKWLPQQDLLAHPNVKVFVTQGGLQSAEEAIANGVPLVGMPFFGDQPMNIVKLAEAGIAIHLDKETVTKDELKKAIIEVAENKKYRDKVAEIRDLLNDQPMKSIDKAIWWIEYVIRHKGARHLRSPALDIPWWQYFLLDVIGVTLAVLALVFYLTYKLVRFTLRLLLKTQKLKTS